MASFFSIFNLRRLRAKEEGEGRVATKCRRRGGRRNKIERSKELKSYETLSYLHAYNANRNGEGLKGMA